jgi:phosphoadenosine phosphosulfate reductase
MRPTDRDRALWASREFASSQPYELLEWAIVTFGDQFCLTTSLADAVMVDMACRIKPGVNVLFVDTGYHFAETMRTRDELAARYPITLISVRPERTVAEQDTESGPNLFNRDADLCCRMRKVEPINAALTGYRAWASGIRRDEAPTRRNVGAVEWDAVRSLVKVNPLVNWTKADVETYITDHGVLVSPLLARGYLSIGCAPCTLPAALDGDARSGRWVGKVKTECGLHTD